MVADCGYTSAWDEFAYQLNKLFGLPAFPMLNIANLITKIRAGYWINESSPINQTSKSKTPTLFIHSDEDYRCPLCEGLQMLNALLDQNIEARMCLFHGENHDLSRTGLPQHRLRCLNEITNWMEKHLK